MNRHLERRTRKYVIATTSSPTLYLRKTPSKIEYEFVSNIEVATKTLYPELAETILRYYYCDIEYRDDLVVIPVEISYELIEE